MEYAPKAKSKFNLKIIIPILVVVLAIASFGVYKMIQKEETKESFTVCGLSHEKTLTALEKTYKNTYSLSDYLFYGESLDLYHDTYDVTSTDDLAGKSVILRDICSDKEFSFVIRSSVDAQILLHNITQGYYEVFVVEDLIEKRAVFTSNVNTSITSIARNNTRLQVSLLADQDYFSARGVKADKNYVYIRVKESKIEEDQYDIAIDPAAYDRDFTYLVSEGSEGNGLIEYQETYKAATLLKDKLEAKGLKVLILRGEKEESDSYGEDGKLQRAYQAKAKYYIKLRFEESQLNYDGMDITYSGHTNGSFSKQIIYHLSRNSGVKISSIYNLNDPGNIQCTLYKGNLDGRVVYDTDLAIRESGGKATQAGMYSKNAQEGTAFFAKDNIYGMNAISINLGYLTSSSDVDYWLNHQEEYIGALADGMASYWNLEQD